ncbi:MAG: thioredoxin domain-containing protein [Candidatus Kaiserbacteria bacterium]|nr:thioredoxin domain-containing protein [Candidatus Kaiserbacteria bacterium]
MRARSRRLRYPALYALVALTAFVLIIAWYAVAHRAVAPLGVIRPVDSHDHIRGSGDVRLIIYMDLRCVHCQHLDTVDLPRIEKTYPDRLQIVYRNLPLEGIHPGATLAAEAAECVARTGGSAAYWKFVHAAYQPAQGRVFDAVWFAAAAASVGAPTHAYAQCIERGEGKAAIARDLTDATRAAFTLTPTIVVEKGERQIVVEGDSYTRIVAAIELLINGYE